MKYQRWKGILRLFVEVTGILMLFYRDLYCILLFEIPLFFWGYRRLRAIQREQRKWQINLEFKEGLQGIASALNAGYSIENALAESKKDLEILYGKDSVLCQEFQIMLNQLHFNKPMEVVFDEFAKRSGVEDIRSFAEIFRTARRSGGDLVAITRTASERIGEKIELSREINTLLSGKQMEGKIMNLIPLGMIFYFWICSPGFLDCLYEGVWGHIIMTGLIALYLFAYEMNRKICQIIV